VASPPARAQPTLDPAVPAQADRRSMGPETGLVGVGRWAMVARHRLNRCGRPAHQVAQAEGRVTHPTITSLANPRHPYWTARRGIWLITHTPVTATYPCRCKATSRCDPRWCPCAGRVDVETMPTICCARRAVETENRRRAEESENDE